MWGNVYQLEFQNLSADSLQQSNQSNRKRITGGEHSRRGQVFPKDYEPAPPIGTTRLTHVHRQCMHFCLQLFDNFPASPKGGRKAGRFVQHVHDITSGLRRIDCFIWQRATETTLCVCESDTVSLRMQGRITRDRWIRLAH